MGYEPGAAAGAGLDSGIKFGSDSLGARERLRGPDAPRYTGTDIGMPPANEDVARTLHPTYARGRV